MDYEFSSKEELFKRVGPALRSKTNEFKKTGYAYIRDIDIWNYLGTVRWSKAVNLMLADVVGDILNVSGLEIEKFMKEKMIKKNQSQEFDDSLELL